VEDELELHGSVQSWFHFISCWDFLSVCLGSLKLIFMFTVVVIVILYIRSSFTYE
jgi:hypothetical protein